MWLRAEEKPGEAEFEVNEIDDTLCRVLERLKADLEIVKIAVVQDGLT